MLTEKYRSQIGAIKSVPIRKKKYRTKKNIEIGEVYECDTTREGSWAYPFFGIVEKIYNNSALVRIISTQELDDRLVEQLQSRTVVRLNNMFVRES
ncbi:hypothetical protein ACFFH2_15730 [Enterococcus devriesei]|uniref:Uncharacterized protein n=1 Tax=Enterococcus devriesei TaxID=319970 RepID=A0A1L8SL47_9ENTE|nr:hypothetical protein [Enterococcus devriesei]OJG32701.1 hypothetical protein RV00_GL001543 [Enterococcus devriesei]